MTTKKFSKSEAIKFGWNVAKSNIWFFIKIFFIVFFISFVFNYLSETLRGNLLLLSIIYGLNLFFNIVISPGLVKISLNFCYNQKSNLSDLFSQYRLVFKYLLSTFLYGLSILIGVIFLIIPGVILSIRLQFYPYFIVDKGLGPVEALRKSWQITKGTAWNLFIFNLILGGIILLGLLALIIGSLWAIPTTWVAHAFVYTKLLRQIEPQTSETTPSETTSTETTT